MKYISDINVIESDDKYLALLNDSYSVTENYGPPDVPQLVTYYKLTAYSFKTQEELEEWLKRMEATDYNHLKIKNIKILKIQEIKIAKKIELILES